MKDWLTSINDLTSFTQWKYAHPDDETLFLLQEQFENLASMAVGGLKDVDPLTLTHFACCGVRVYKVKMFEG